MKYTPKINPDVRNGPLLYHYETTPNIGCIFTADYSYL